MGPEVCCSLQVPGVKGFPFSSSLSCFISRYSQSPRSLVFGIASPDNFFDSWGLFEVGKATRIVESSFVEGSRRCSHVSSFRWSIAAACSPPCECPAVGHLPYLEMYPCACRLLIAGSIVENWVHPNA